MLKLLAALVGIACLLAFSMEVRRASEKSPHYYERYAHGTKIKSDHQNEQKWEWGHADPGVTLVAFCLALIAAVQAGLFLVQLKLIRESLAPAEQAAKAAADTAKAIADNERPWVGPVTVNCDQIIAGQPSRGTIVIKNTGRSPAIRIRIVHTGVILNQGQAPVVPNAWEAPKALFPNAEDFYHPPVEGGPLSQADASALVAGTRVLWIIARIEYFDGNGNFHHTNISTRWGGVNRPVMVPDGDNDAN
jgi:hypothetical protein